MSQLRPGEEVSFDDPWGYTGTGKVISGQEHPTDAVLVKVETITDRTDQSAVGREVWILAPHVRPKEA